VAQPEGYPPVEALKILPADAGVMLTDDQATKQAFADLFGG